MPASPKFYSKLSDKIRNAPNRSEQDRYLDQWNHIRAHATEYDAVRWGFPDDWMRTERVRMAQRGPMKEPTFPVSDREPST